VKIWPIAWRRRILVVVSGDTDSTMWVDRQVV